MSKIAKKLANLPKTLYEHKKKTVFFSFLGYLGVDWVYRWNRNQNIRAEYAKIAVKYGEKTVSPEDKPKRVFVLVNVEGNLRNCFDAFQKNALPLFHLAGVQVDIVKAKDEQQLEALAGAVDNQEADILYVVGGDGTISTTLTGIFRNRDQASLPIGFYPGGYDNLWLKKMMPTVFEETEDVRHACESAMAVIEDVRRNVYAFEIKQEESGELPKYGLGDVSAGWFRQIEDTRKKMWYFSVMRRRWAYIWEMIKRSPEKIECQIEYEEPCDGCSKCRPPIIIEAPQWRWWHVLSGAPKFKNDQAIRDFSGIINEKCGEKKQLEVKGAEIIVENEQMKDYSQLRLRVGGSESGRIGVIADGFDRCSKNIVGKSTDDRFYQVDLLAKEIKLKIESIPTYINRLYISSNATNKDDDMTGKSFKISGTLKKVEVFLPENIRLQGV